jgi:diguanylate cyclase (GGDEF)-like protein
MFSMTCMENPTQLHFIRLNLFHSPPITYLSVPERHSFMSLYKTTALVSSALVVFMLVVFVVLYLTIYRNTFKKMETAHIQDHIRGLNFAINKELHQLDTVAADYASWDLTYDYMVTRRPGYVSSELTDDSLSSLNVNVFMLLDKAGDIELLKIVGGRANSLSSDELHIIARSSSRLSRNTVQGGITGVINTATLPLLIAIRPVLTSRNQGPSRGSLVLARRLDQALLSDLGETFRGPVQFLPLQDVPLAEAKKLQTREEGAATIFLQENSAEIYLLLRDLNSQPIGALKASISRQMWHDGEKRQVWVLVLLALAGAARTFFNLAFIRRRVVSRIVRLGELVKDVNRTGDLSRRAEYFGSDEIGQLARTLNRMLAKLEATQASLIGTQERLELEASHDPLTGALNRRAGLEAIERELTRCRRDRRTLALFVLDIDNFKSINDTFGHGGGDAVLVALSKTLSNALRPFDSLIRAGGDEFIIVTPGTGLTDGKHIGERLLRRFRSTVIEWKEAHLKVTASIGLACCSGELSADELIARADRALYRAKANGRDCFETEEFTADVLLPTVTVDSEQAACSTSQ